MILYYLYYIKLPPQENGPTMPSVMKSLNICNFLFRFVFVIKPDKGSNTKEIRDYAVLCSNHLKSKDFKKLIYIS